MKKIVTLLMIIFIVNNVNGQSEIDSLQNVFQVKLNEELSLRDQNLDSIQNYLSQLILDRDNQLNELRNEM